MTSMGRRIAQIVTVGAVVLVLTGTVASPADAMKRREAVRAANAAISMCFHNGGNPDAYEYGGTLYVSCTWEDGSVDTLDYSYDQATGSRGRSLATAAASEEIVT